MVVFLVLVALSRWPGLFPPNFSVVYALVFCAGVYFPKSLAWWLPLGTLALTDVALNFYYQSKGYPVWTWLGVAYQLSIYVAYAAIIWLGRNLGPQAKFLTLLGGGMLGAVLFYLVTNTASWLLSPEYAKSFSGWLIALVKGTNGWPQTWEFFRNTLLSGGLFTVLFAAAQKLTASAESPADKTAGVGAPEAKDETDAEPEEAKA